MKYLSLREIRFFSLSNIHEAWNIAIYLESMRDEIKVHSKDAYVQVKDWEKENSWFKVLLVRNRRCWQDAVLQYCLRRVSTQIDERKILLGNFRVYRIEEHQKWTSVTISQQNLPSINVQFTLIFTQRFYTNTLTQILQFLNFHLC